MKLLNIMLGCGMGGIEQAAYDYHEALALAGHEVCTLLHPSAQMQPVFAAETMHTLPLRAYGNWDILAARSLRHHATRLGAQAIICHGNRALSLALRGLSGRIPVIGVAHNYKIKKRFGRCDAVLCITRDLIEECVHLDMPRSKLHHVPNLTRLPVATARNALRQPIVIGTMGRFVAKKGIDILLHSLHALKQQNIPFRARIGGDGELAGELQQLAQQLGIAQEVEFLGWVQNKPAFFESIDVFVLPSHHEPFGIVLIEAMAAGLPVITTDTEGPCEIITPHHDALLVDKAKPHALASALCELIDAPELALKLGQNARQTVASTYDLPVVSAQLDNILRAMLRPTT